MRIIWIFLELIEEVNDRLAGEVDFAFLSGDNADDGSEAQYETVRAALDRLRLPVHSIAGDHDRKPTPPALYCRSPTRRILLFITAACHRSGAGC